MKNFAMMIAAAGLAFAPASALAGKGGNGKGNGPAPKTDICHWSEGQGAFFVINISENAVDAHFHNHGDSYPSTYFADADGDGFGDPNGATDPCPNAGFVANADDCDDTNPATHPGADEVCDDGIDNNCDGNIDEGCSVCPCFDPASLQASYDSFHATSWDQSNEVCDVVTYPPYYDYTHLYWTGYNQSPYEYTNEGSYSLDYDYYGEIYCVNYENGYDSSAGYTNEFEQIYITEDEHADCEAILEDFAASHGIACNYYNF